MQKKTYVHQSLKNGGLMRWTYMPLKVYIAPMKFYSKAGEDMKYRSMVKNALDAWQNAAHGKVSFRIVNTLLESNVNIDWKRVERKALGHCYFSFDSANRLYSAEVSIGLTEGLIHRDYMDESEVYHTILHEIGHAIGLGHSPYRTDIMYTPHQHGINSISSGDALTVNWLYTFPQGASFADLSSKYGTGGNDIDDIVTKLMNKQLEKSEKPVMQNVPKRDLLEEQENIALLRKYHMALQNVKISDDMKKFFTKPKNR